MSNLITFGKHEGKSMEWLFFKAPWYAEFIYRKGIHQQEHNFTEEAGDYFHELYRRAWQLKGACRYCNERPILRMGLSTHVSGKLGHIGFYCEECEYTGGSAASYHRLSFFVDTHTLPRCEQLRITDVIKRRYIGPYERLTQKKMEEFFRTDEHFVDAAPGFFAEAQAVEISG